MATQTSHDSSVTTQTSVESVNNECKSVHLYVWVLSGCSSICLFVTCFSVWLSCLIMLSAS